MELPVVSNKGAASGVPTNRRGHKRLPPWMKKRLGPAGPIHEMKVKLRGRGLHTVCEEASCPNLGECWSAGTATFMILGDICTRHCGFCDVTAGKPGPVDAEEPRQVAEMVKQMNLKHVVITCVARDDLEDGGAAHYVTCIEKVRAQNPKTDIEVLTTDFQMNEDAIRLVIAAGPTIFNHNVETVERLTSIVRHRATYQQSLSFLKLIKTMNPDQRTKSGLMLGLGETEAEIMTTLRDLRSVGCEIVTIGQYLRPAKRNLPVVDFIPPEKFVEYEKYAYDLGFYSVASGPFVRSSYHAEEMVIK
jgi:lipoyl synthase